MQVTLTKCVVSTSRTLGSGCYRTAFSTGFMYAPEQLKQKQWVLKRAIGQEGAFQNRFEFELYNALVDTDYEDLLQVLPEFADISKCSKYVLVEMCKTMHQIHRDADEQYEWASEHPAFKDKPKVPLRDDHIENWGFTVLDNRPVIMDLAASLTQMECFLDENVPWLREEFDWIYKVSSKRGEGDDEYYKFMEDLFYANNPLKIAC